MRIGVRSQQLVARAAMLATKEAKAKARAAAKAAKAKKAFTLELYAASSVNTDELALATRTSISSCFSGLIR